MTTDDDIVGYLGGTCQSAEEAAEALDVPPDIVESVMAEEGWERCSACDWWCESCEMELNDSGEPECEDCRSA